MVYPGTWTDILFDMPNMNNITYYLGLENITYNIDLFKDMGAQYSLTI